MRLALAGIVSLVVLAVAPIAEAAQRYAAPGGWGTACTAPSPCPIAEAIGQAQADDEVILGTGIYTSTEELFASTEGVTIHGDFSAPMPVIKAAFAGAILSVPQNGLVSYVEVDNVGDFAGGIFCAGGNSVERVVARVSGKQSVAGSALSGCAIRDSLLLAAGAKSIALYGAAFEDGLTGTVRNVTAIATGDETTGVLATYGPAAKGSYTMDVRNTIADGSAADAFASEGTEGVGNITISSSNFDRPKQDAAAKLTNGGGNQAVAPLFVNAAGGDYREAAGSPTIDAGVADPSIGATDLSGGPRVAGAAVDIGAYEFLPAVAGEIQALGVTPKKFRARPAGGAIVSFKDKVVGPAGAMVAYSLSAATTVVFTVERKLVGRRAGKRCVKKTKANKGKKKCLLFKLVKGSFAHSGAAGTNAFRFSGRVGGGSLGPGAYRLTGRAGTSSRVAGFKILG